MTNGLLQERAPLLRGDTRLHELQGSGALAGLWVEAWSQREALNQPTELHLSALSLDAGLDTALMLGQRVTLLTRLADGRQAARSGIVMQASAEESDGGLARYRLVVGSWFGLLAHTRRSQVFQDKRLIDIVEAVFGDYREHAAWVWSPCVRAHLAQSPCGADARRNYAVQYRETDLAFVSRLLADEGLNYRFEPDETAPLGHRLVIFADSTLQSSCPEDTVSAADGGVRYHRAAAVEVQDAIQTFGSERQWLAAEVAVLSWDAQARRSVAAAVPTDADFGDSGAPRLQAYDAVGVDTFHDAAGARRAAELWMQGLEVRHKRRLGRGTVRSFTAGQRFTITQSALDDRSRLGGPMDVATAATLAGHAQFLLTEVIHAGINNLPKDASAKIAQSLGDSGPDLLPDWVEPAVRQQAAQTGYANAFQASRVAVPWRPLQAGLAEAQIHGRPTAPGALTATVVGPDGQSRARGADEIHTDMLGRIRIQFDFQHSAAASTGAGRSSAWVRVAQAMAGGGMGLQFIPRIGQEVLVQFLGGDIDRPVVVGSLYNGQGEGGVPATPGGQAADADLSAFANSSDHRPSAQGNLAAGNGPAWHGAAPGPATTGSNGQNNAAALSGFKSKEFGASGATAGFNQLVFDDSTGQLRTQLATTQHATQLNLGHLIHQADNHRGSFRGLGWELRTDAYGAVRGGSGLLISSYGAQPGDPAGDNTAGIALARQLGTLGQVLDQAASIHQTVRLAGQIGSTQTGRSQASDQAAPFKALLSQVSGMVSRDDPEQAQADAASGNTLPADDKLPHSAGAIVAIAAKAGLIQTAGQDVQLSAQDTLTWASGQDTEHASGGAIRIHAGQAIGLLGGAIKPGSEATGTGLTLIAAQGPITYQAQADAMQIAAKGQLTVQSASGKIDWASAKKIVISTAGGASMTIEGGNITFECPGTLTVKASTKAFEGAGRLSYAMPALPRSICLACLRKSLAAAPAFTKVE